MSLNTFIATVATSIIALAMVPAFAFAQTNTCGQTNNSVWGWNNTSTNCTPGNLLVYVQVLNNANNGYNRVPSDFTVSVSAPTVSQTSFVGSLSGTQVLVTGSYSVQALPLAGYNATYSTGCNGMVVNGQQATCIITENNSSLYNNYPNSYYPGQYYQYSGYGAYYSVPLTCAPTNQTVSIGQSITFTAQGGDVSQFNWYNSVNPNNKSYNVGRTYTTSFLSPGTQNVTVTNGDQYATCAITVVGYPIAGYPAAGYPVNPGYAYPNGVMTTPAVTVTPTYIPRLPNTGFGPTNGAALAFALAFLIAAALVVYPYAKQAFAIVLR